MPGFLAASILFSCVTASYPRGDKIVAAPVCGVTVIVLIWGVLLPSIATWPGFEADRIRFEECGVDASALFYTDHPRTFDAKFRSR